MKNASERSKLQGLLEAGWTLEDIIKLLDELERITSFLDEQGYTLEDKVRETLVQLGVPTTVAGYHYLTDAIIEYINDCFVKYNDLNFKIAHKYNSTPSQVSRAIWYSIDVAFSTAKPHVIEEVFGTIDYKTGKIAPKKFISGVGEYVKRKRKKS